MKKNYVQDLKAGDNVDENFVLSEKTLAQKRDGANYLNLVLADKTGTIKGVMWDHIEKLLPDLKTGIFVRIKGTVSEYRGDLQLVVKSLRHLSEKEADLADFIPASRYDIEDLFQRMVSLTETFNSEYYRALFQRFWEDDTFVQRFKQVPAGKKMHHAYIGGLLEHCLSMASLAEKVARHYSGIDRDLLLAGAILHDIGKTRELTCGATIDYSDEGRLLSHIVIGLQMVDEKIRLVPDFPPEQAMLLKHMIVSHHGAREFGSPEPPKTLEAVLLNYIDEMDSRVNGIREFIDKQAPSESWTPYHRILGRHFYMGRKE